MTLPALGIDLGLSGARAAVVDRAGRLLGRGRVASALRREARKAEHAPEAWQEAAFSAGRQALQEAGCRGVAGIGVGALGPCPVLLDGEGRPLSPAPLFSLDNRAEGHRQRLAARMGLGQEDLGPDHALPKLLWLSPAASRTIWPPRLARWGVVISPPPPSPSPFAVTLHHRGR